MTAITPILTNAGVNALYNADNDGLQAVISHIAVGTGIYNPNATRTALQAETQRVAISQSEKIDDYTRKLEALLDGPQAYDIREVGVFLEDGTVLAVWSSLTQTAGFKNADTQSLVALQLGIASALPNSWTVSAPDATLSVAEHLVVMATALTDICTRQIQFNERLNRLEKG